MKKILIIQQKMIGDVLVSSIICNNLRKAYPNAQIDYMVYESTVDVLKGNSSIDNIILFKESHRASKRAFYKLLKELQGENYELVIDSYSKLESWITVLFLRKSRRISFKKPFRKFLYSDNVEFQQIPKSNLGLIIERRLSLLNPLDLNIEIDPLPKLFVTNDEKVVAENLFKKHNIDRNNRTIMISLLGSSDNKTYPFSKMSELLDFIASNEDVNILFNYFPKQVQEAKQIFDACSKNTQSKIYFDVLGNSLREFIAIMSACDMIIGNDGGAINMAKSLNKPAFTIFSPWIEKKMWATFEDGVFNKSVHLEDYLPKLFLNKNQKQLKEESLDLYKSFEFDFFKNELKDFLINHRESIAPRYDHFKIRKREKLSVLIITYNEVENVKDLVASVSFANEIIVVDSYSIDGTYEELLKYDNVKVIQREFDNFSDQRNFAASQATNEWVLFVDADERLSDALKNEIVENINNNNGVVTFGMYRKLYLNDRLLKYGGYQSEKVYRLYHKDYAHYNPKKLVHEVLIINGKSKLLNNKVVHYSYENDDSFKAKLNFYAKLRAKELKSKGVKSNWYYFYVKPFYRFFHMFFIRFGFLDGKNGFKIARLQSYGVRQRYVELKKLYAQEL